MPWALPAEGADEQGVGDTGAPAGDSTYGYDERANLVRTNARVDGYRFAPNTTLGVGDEIGILREAARGKGNFGVGSATRAEADTLGQSWVGEGFRVGSDGKTLISQDGLRQFRPPTYKPGLGKWQANLEQRWPDVKQWQSNAHLDILDP